MHRAEFLRAMLLGGGRLALGREPAPERPTEPRPLFPQLVPQPTGRNGYEEFLRAADLIRGFRALEEVRERPTLTRKRAVMGDPRAARALDRIRRGLAKPVQSVRTESEAATALFPEFAPFRRLGFLLALEQEILFADGRVRDALTSLRDGIRFSRAIRVDGALSYLVGAAVQAIVLAVIGRRLDQLAAGDCEALFRLGSEFARAPDPLVNVFADEGRVAEAMLGELFRQRSPAEFAEAIRGLDSDPPPPGLDRLTPAALEAELRRTRELLRGRFAQLVEEARRPHWERRPPAPALGDGIAEWLVNALSPISEALFSRAATERAQYGLLACHGAIRRYRWEYDRWPPGLEVLRLGDLARDPFTGEPLHYAVAGDRYVLRSVGPPAPDDPRAIDGRRPVTIEPLSRPP